MRLNKCRELIVLDRPHVVTAGPAPEHRQAMIVYCRMVLIKLAHFLCDQFEPQTLASVDSFYVILTHFCYSNYCFTFLTSTATATATAATRTAISCYSCYCYIAIAIVLLPLLLLC